MSETAEQPKKSRSKRIYILWAGAFAILLILGLSCWFVVIPIMRVRRAVEYSAMWGDLGTEDGKAAALRNIRDLGGHESASRLLGLYLQTPRRFAPYRATAAEMLALCGEPAIGKLVFLLGDENEDIAEIAAAGLADIGKAAVGPLIAALGDDNWVVRVEAAAALGQIGDPRAVSSLVVALADRDPSVRGAATSALAEIGDTSCVPALIAALNSEDAQGLSDAIARALGKLKDLRAVQPLIDRLGDRRDWARHQAARELANFKSRKVVEALCRALQDKVFWIRYRAAVSLGALADPRATDSLKSALKDDDARVRKAAREALGRIPSAPPSRSEKR